MVLANVLVTLLPEEDPTEAVVEVFTPFVGGGYSRRATSNVDLGEDFLVDLETEIDAELPENVQPV